MARAEAVKQPSTGRILIAGGSGNLGCAAATVLVKLGEGHRVNLVARSRERLARAAWRLSIANPLLVVDVRDEDAFARLIRPGDTVVNATSRIDRVSALPLRAAVRAGAARYFDAYDESEPVAAVLSEAALPRTHGIRGITGIGIAPGITNALAAIAFGRLSSTRELVTGWKMPPLRAGGMERGPANVVCARVGEWAGVRSSIDHLWKCLSQDGLVIEQSVVKHEPAFRPLDLPWSDGRAFKCRTVDSSEPMLLHHEHPGLEHSVSAFFGDQESCVFIARLRRRFARGDMSAQQCERALMGAAVRGAFACSAPPVGRSASLFAYGTGDISGLPATVIEQVEVTGRLLPAHAGAALGFAAAGRIELGRADGLITVGMLPDPSTYMEAICAGARLIGRPITLRRSANCYTHQRGWH